MLSRIDIEALKSRHPIETVAAGYGVELRRTGRSLVGRCPIHRDRGRPNFHVYTGSNSWYCYRCGLGGDVVSLIQKVEGLGFREAVERLDGGGRESHRRPPVTIRPATARQTSSEERACLAAAVEL